MSRCPLRRPPQVEGSAVEQEVPFSCSENSFQTPPSSSPPLIYSPQPPPPSDGPFALGHRGCPEVCVQLGTEFRTLCNSTAPTMSVFCPHLQSCSLLKDDARRPPWLHSVRCFPAWLWWGLNCGSLCSCGSSRCVEHGPVGGSLCMAAGLRRWLFQEWVLELEAGDCIFMKYEIFTIVHWYFFILIFIGMCTGCGHTWSRTLVTGYAAVRRGRGWCLAWHNGTCSNHIGQAASAVLPLLGRPFLQKGNTILQLICN